MFLVLATLFIGLPILEFYVLFEVGHEIGFLNTVSIIFFTGFFGAYLARLHGMNSFIRIQQELQHGQLPTQEILSAFSIFGGGLLLLTPGFVTDVIGFSMVIPLTRHILIRLLKIWFERGINSGRVQFYSFGQSTQGRGNQKSEASIEGIYEAEFEKKSEI